MVLGIRSYVGGVLLGLVAFVAQLATIGAVNFLGLAERTSAIASHALQQMVRSPEAMLWLGYYALLGVIAHALPFLLALKITSDLKEARNTRIRTMARQRGATLLVVLIMFAGLLAWDRRLFPRTLMISNGTVADVAETLLPVGVTSLLLVSLLLIWLFTAASRRSILATLAVPMLVLTTAFYAPEPERASVATAPNIIVLGVDSLRPDHLAAFGAPRPVTPHVDDFIAHAINFRQAYTPMGRTFVAYSSILSGQYPVHHGVRENLYPRALFNRSLLLPATLRQQGYRTVFALDEVRFANIDREFGFDEVVTPPSGAIELIAGTLFDTAGTNLLQLVPGMAGLLPHVTGNRARHEGYVPTQQNQKIAHAIQATPATQPLLLVAHFTMPHIPFARGSWRRETLPAPYEDSPPAYRKALSIADRQVGATLDALRQAGRLDNAIVVLLSDHGEGLSMNKDDWKLDDRYRNQFNVPQNFGHGGLALEDTQAHVVLAIQRYVRGKPAWPRAQAEIQASLVDVAPSLLNLADVPYARARVDGMPLLAHDGTVIATSRPAFVESGIFGQALETIDVDEQAVANEFIHLYKVTPDLRMELQPAILPELLGRKQRGVIWRNYGVSTMPEATAAGCWLVVNYKRRTRTCVEHPSDHPVADAYSHLICQQFAADQTFRKRWCGQSVASASQASPSLDTRTARIKMPPKGAARAADRPANGR